MLKLIFILFFAMLNTFCKKDDVVMEKPNNCFYCEDSSEKFQLEVLWSQPIDISKDYHANNLIPVVYNNYVLIGALKLENEVVYCLDKLTGNKIWEWNDYSTSRNYTKIVNVVNNLGIISSTYRDYAIDLNTGQTQWKYTSLPGFEARPRANLTGGYLYHPQDQEGVGAGVDSIAWMMRTKPEYPQWDTVYTERMDSTGCNVNFEPPVLWINPQGDSNLVFQRRIFNYYTSRERADFIVYNLKRKQITSRINDISGIVSSSVHPILIVGDKAIFLSAHTVFCINLMEGNIVWQYTGKNPATNNLALATPIILNNQLFVKTEGDLMYCLDINTGSPKWVREIMNTSTCSNLVGFENKLYFIGLDYLYCVSSTNGNVVFKYKSPNAFRTNKKGSFRTYSTLSVDPNTGYMYFADSYYFNCVKLK